MHYYLLLSSVITANLEQAVRRMNRAVKGDSSLETVDECLKRKRKAPKRFKGRGLETSDSESESAKEGASSSDSDAPLVRAKRPKQSRAPR